jgi:xylulokinase
MAGANVTVGIDIGTSSVKAIAADDDGNVVARARIPHDFSVPSPQRFQHDARVAWHDGPQRALEALGDIDARAVSVAAMVPSLTAVDADGVPVTPGLLYGDERGHQEQKTDQPERGELGQFLRWQVQTRPDARG